MPLLQQQAPKALVVRSVSCQWRLSDINKWPTSRESVAAAIQHRREHRPLVPFSATTWPPFPWRLSGHHTKVHTFSHTYCHQSRPRESVVRSDSTSPWRHSLMPILRCPLVFPMAAGRLPKGHTSHHFFHQLSSLAKVLEKKTPL